VQSLPIYSSWMDCWNSSNIVVMKEAQMNLLQRSYGGTFCPGSIIKKWDSLNIFSKFRLLHFFWYKSMQLQAWYFPEEHIHDMDSFYSSLIKDFCNFNRISHPFYPSTYESNLQHQNSLLFMILWIASISGRNHIAPNGTTLTLAGLTSNFLSLNSSPFWRINGKAGFW